MAEHQRAPSKTHGCCFQSVTAYGHSLKLTNIHLEQVIKGPQVKHIEATVLLDGYMHLAQLRREEVCQRWAGSV